MRFWINCCPLFMNYLKNVSLFPKKNKMNRKIVLFFILSLSLLIVSCSSTEKFALLQNVSTTNETKTANFQAVLQPDDLLMIMI